MSALTVKRGRHARYGGHTICECFVGPGVHAARQRAWTRSERLCGSYSTESLVRVAMVISIISWQADRGGGDAAIATIGCACINAPKVEAKSCGVRNAKGHRRDDVGAATRRSVDDCVPMRRKVDGGAVPRRIVQPIIADALIALGGHRD